MESNKLVNLHVREWKYCVQTSNRYFKAVTQLCKKLFNIPDKF